MESNGDKEKLKFLVVEETKYHTKLTKKFENRVPYVPFDEKKMFALIPGTISKITVSKGDKVKKGDDLLILDAMKMKNRIIALKDGKIKNVCVEVGQQIPKNTLLIEFDK